MGENPDGVTTEARIVLRVTVSNLCCFGLRPVVWSLCWAIFAINAAAAEPNQLAGTATRKSAAPRARESAAPRKQLFKGRVVVLRDALKRRGITAFAEFGDQVVLETPQGQLIPIVPDWRGRAFFQDSRLRDRAVELVGYRRSGIPYLQVLMVFTFDKAGVRQYTDYWCEICSIPMYEIKPCDCCQADIELRFQPRDLPSYLRTVTESRAVKSPKP